MNRRPRHVDKTVIDPLFVIPIGAEETFTYSKESIDEDNGVFLDDGNESTEVDDGSEDENQIGLDTPDTIAIFKQVLRRAPGGQQVVDATFTIEDIDGALNYEIQVVKI